MYQIIIGIVLLVLFFMWNGPKKLPLDKLTKKAAKWATRAQQDESPYIAVMHANYAAGYLWALRDMASPELITKQTGVDFHKLEEHINNVQDMVTKKTIKKCPEFAGDVDLFLSSIADGDDE
jgi:hypothetical protein